MSTFNAIVPNVFLRYPDSVYTTLSDFYAKHSMHIKYPAAVAAFDITQLAKTNMDKGSDMGDNTIAALIHTIQLALSVPVYLVQDFDARILTVCPDVGLQKLTEVANQIRKEFDNVIFGLGEAHSNFSINMAIEEATESSRIQQMLNPKSKKHETLFALLSMMKASDKSLEQHVKRTQKLSVKIADKMGLSFLDKSQLQLICILHDIGKLFIPQEIVQKPGGLSVQEMDIMKQHAAKGSDFLSKMPSFENIALCVRYHHERYDGKGYPDGISGHTIPLLSRIVSVVDAYDAMANDRVYRKALSERTIVDELLEGMGKQFDPHVASILITMIENGEIQPGKEIV